MRYATTADIEQILAITDSARRFQRQCGFRQWEDGYPAYDDITADIADQGAYIFENEGTSAKAADITIEGSNIVERENIVAYAYLTGYDAEYDRLSGIWHYPGPYGVIHRLAIAPGFRGQGLAAQILAMSEAHLAAQGIRAMRIDTGQDNIVMQRILSRADYTCRGLHHFTWGPRLAYEKPLTQPSAVRNRER